MNHRTNPTKILRAERIYGKQLKQLARHVGEIVSGFGGDGDVPTLVQLLQKYAEALIPWARVTAGKMIAEVNQRDIDGWRRHGMKISESLRRDIINAPVGETMRALLDSQVELITSIPLDAAKRVHDLTLKGLEGSRRADEVAAEIMRTGDVTSSRAMLIARTETSRTATVLVQARSMSVGSEMYVWRSSGDGDVRPDHKKLNGKAFRWDSPPIADERTGAKAHPGSIYNCFPGDTKLYLLNGAERLFRHLYNGPIVEFKFNRGSLAVTPYHPILTTRGWIPAGEINESDDIVELCGDDGFIVENEIDQGIPTFNDLFVSFFIPRDETIGIKFNFHGHIPDGHVDNVFIDGILPDHRVSASLNGVRNFVFSGANIRNAFPQSCGFDHVACPRFAGAGDKFNSPIFCHLSHPNLISGGLISNGDIVRYKDFPYSATADSYCTGDRKLAFPTCIEGDYSALGKIVDFIMSAGNMFGNFDSSSPDVLAYNVGVISNINGSFFESGARTYHLTRFVDKRILDFSGHVFTLQSSNGWFGVSERGIVAKNCRCYPEPIIPD